MLQSVTWPTAEHIEEGDWKEKTKEGLMIHGGTPSGWVTSDYRREVSFRAHESQDRPLVQLTVDQVTSLAPASHYMTAG